VCLGWLDEPCLYGYVLAMNALENYTTKLDSLIRSELSNEGSETLDAVRFIMLDDKNISESARLVSTDDNNISRQAVHHRIHAFVNAFYSKYKEKVDDVYANLNGIVLIDKLSPTMHLFDLIKKEYYDDPFVIKRLNKYAVFAQDSLFNDIMVFNDAMVTKLKRISCISIQDEIDYFKLTTQVDINIDRLNYTPPIDALIRIILEYSLPQHLPAAKLEGNYIVNLNARDIKLVAKIMHVTNQQMPVHLVYERYKLAREKRQSIFMSLHCFTLFLDMAKKEGRIQAVIGDKVLSKVELFIFNEFRKINARTMLISSLANKIADEGFSRIALIKSIERSPLFDKKNLSVKLIGDTI